MSKEIIMIQKKKLEDMTDAEINIGKYRSLERRYNSVIEAVLKVEAQNNVFRAEIETCYKKMENAQKNVDINKTIVMNTIIDSNSKIQSYLSEIAELKTIISDLRTK